jgi:hypothetical protein
VRAGIPLRGVPARRGGGANAAVLPLSMTIIAREVAVAWAVTALVLWASLPVARDLVARGMWVSTCTLLFSVYGGLVATLAIRLGVTVNTMSRKEPEMPGRSRECVWTHAGGPSPASMR